VSSRTEDENCSNPIIRAAGEFIAIWTVIPDYNGYSSRMLNRKPEYIGRDIRDCHEKAASIEKIDHMLAEFKKGRREEFIIPLFLPSLITHSRV